MQRSILCLLILGCLTSCTLDTTGDLKGPSAAANTGGAGGGGISGVIADMWADNYKSTCMGNDRYFSYVSSIDSETQVTISQDRVTYTGAGQCAVLDTTGATTLDQGEYIITYEYFDPGATPNVGSGQFFLMVSSEAGNPASTQSFVGWYDGTGAIIMRMIADGKTVTDILAEEGAFLLDPSANAHIINSSL